MVASRHGVIQEQTLPAREAGGSPSAALDFRGGGEGGRATLEAAPELGIDVPPLSARVRDRQRSQRARGLVAPQKSTTSPESSSPREGASPPRGGPLGARAKLFVSFVVQACPASAKRVKERRVACHRGAEETALTRARGSRYSALASQSDFHSEDVGYPRRRSSGRAG